MVIVDRWGNAVSMTNTLGTFFGSGVVAEGTGLVLSNGMDWFDIDENIWTGEKPGPLVMAPGKRNRWTLAPGMLFKDGKLFMVVGGAGAEATMWGIAQPIVNAIDFGMDAQAALSAPRFRYGDIYHYTGGTEAWLEPGIKPGVRDALIKKGHMMSPVDKPRIVARGTTQMIVIDQKTGTMIGGAAPNGRDNLTAY
jgi:gamma-glutamyltranspeptidase/glutathione hydrolase